jgi:hypothetical protein
MKKLLSYSLVTLFLFGLESAHGKKTVSLYPLIVETKQCTRRSGGVYRPGPAPQSVCRPLKTKFLLKWNCDEAGNCKHRVLKFSDDRGLSRLKLLPGAYLLKLVFPEGSRPAGPCSTDSGPETKVVVEPDTTRKRVQLQMTVECHVPSAAPRPKDKAQSGPNDAERE